MVTWLLRQMFSSCWVWRKAAIRCNSEHVGKIASCSIFFHWCNKTPMKTMNKPNLAPCSSILWASWCLCYIDGFLNHHTNWHHPTHPTQTSEGVINPKFWIDMMIILLSTNLAENPPWKQRIYKENLLEDSCAMWNCQMVLHHVWSTPYRSLSINILVYPSFFGCISFLLARFLFVGLFCISEGILKKSSFFFVTMLPLAGRQTPPNGSKIRSNNYRHLPYIPWYKHC